jgi:hypothetical protein
MRHVRLYSLTKFGDDPWVSEESDRKVFFGPKMPFERSPLIWMALVNVHHTCTRLHCFYPENKYLNFRFRYSPHLIPIFHVISLNESVVKESVNRMGS